MELDLSDARVCIKIPDRHRHAHKRVRSGFEKIRSGQGGMDPRNATVQDTQGKYSIYDCTARAQQ